MTNEQELIDILKKLEMPEVLATDLVKYFLQILHEVETRNLEKSSSGKFVETLIQVFQSLDPANKRWDKSVHGVVDHELNDYSSTLVKNIPNESRVTILIVARAMYSLRSKRSHRNNIDPSTYDLECIYHCARWIMTELISQAMGVSVDNARKVVEEIQQPVVPLIENITGYPLVLYTGLTIKEELLLILYEDYNREYYSSIDFLMKALSRRHDGLVFKEIKKLWDIRLVEGNVNGYRLTQLGILEATEIIRRIGSIWAC